MAYSKDIYLEDAYGINYTFRNMTIGDEFTVGTDAARVAAARAKYPWWIGYCSCSGPGANARYASAGAPQWTDAQILACSSFVAAWNDAIMSTGGAVGQDWYFPSGSGGLGALSLSRCNIIAPHGDFYINWHLLTAFGNYEGMGSAQSSPDVYDFIIVAGAGTTGCNGTYRRSSSLNGRPRYAATIGGVSFIITWSGTQWEITNNTTATLLYHSTSDVRRAYMASGWTADGGTGPAPTVTSNSLTAGLNEVGFGTRLSIWHEEWLDVAGYYGGPQKHVMRSTQYPFWVGATMYAGYLGATGGTATNLLDTFYMEGNTVRGFRFSGRKENAPEAEDTTAGEYLLGNKYVTTYTDAGVAVWRSGSVSGVKECVLDGFNNAGMDLGSGVPSNNYNLRAFDCNYASFLLRGDGSFLFNGVEVDDSPTVFRMEPFVDPTAADPTNPTNWLMTPGGTLTVNGTKVETGIGGGTARYKGTMLLDAIGWVNATFNGVNYSSNINTELLVRVDPWPHANFKSTHARVLVSGLRVFGYVRCLMHHAPTVAAGTYPQARRPKKWFMDRAAGAVKYNSSLRGFEYNSDGGGWLKTDSNAGVAMKEVPFLNRQNWRPLGTYDWDDSVNPGTPIYNNPAI